MAQTILHKANERGSRDHGWLKTKYSFSFSDYYDPQKIHFGALRVLNDDTIAAGMGFGTHPHDNMEIITIPLEGALAHKDSMGNASIIRHGEIQVMSAGSGITHSEFNANEDATVKLLQIWVFPDKKNVTPRYAQLEIDLAQMHNNLLQLISPYPEDAGLWIHQHAWFFMGRFDAHVEKAYAFRKQHSGVYVFVINGSFTVNGVNLDDRDALGTWDTDKISIKANKADSQILLMEVPMEFDLVNNK